MTEWLGRAGLRVLSARHYDAAVRHLAERGADIICIDVGLPARSGYELCEHIRGPLGLTSVPIIITSEHGSSEDMAFAEYVGGNAFLRKPFSGRQLTSCVSSLLDRGTSCTPPKHELARLAGKTAVVRGGEARAAVLAMQAA